jgi:hypothetical protein
MIWHTEFVEGYASDLQAYLMRMTTEGWTVAYLLTNGVNRWTVVCRKGDQ